MPADKVQNTVSRNGLIYAIAAALCLVAPFLVFLTSNGYSAFAVEILPFYVACISLGLLVGALVLLRLRRLAVVALWVCVFSAIAFLYHLESLPLVIVLATISAAVVWMLKDNAAFVILIASGLHVVSTLGIYYLDGSTNGPEVSSGEEFAAESEADLPPVLHLVLDEFAGLRGLPDDLPGGQELVSELIDYYPAHGFSLSSHAFSQYFQTTDSLPNLFNFASSASARAFYSGAGESYALTSNRYFEHLLSLGYTLDIYQSSYLNFCNTPGVPVNSCTTYSSNSIATIADIDLSTRQKSLFILNSYLDSSAFLRLVRRKYLGVTRRLKIDLPAWPSGNSRTGPLATLPPIADLTAALSTLRPGSVHFAHLMIPHYPYIFDADCEIKPSVRTWLNRAPFEVGGQLGRQNDTATRAERYGQYFAQVACTQTIIDELFAAIRASGHWQRAIIIIHGDHGSRIVRHIPRVSNSDHLVTDDFRDTYSAFFAVKVGESKGRLDTSALPLQTLLARTWQLPAPKQEAPQVYLRVPGDGELPATPLIGFDPLPDIQKDR